MRRFFQQSSFQCLVLAFLFGLVVGLGAQNFSPLQQAKAQILPLSSLTCNGTLPKTGEELVLHCTGIQL